MKDRIQILNRIKSHYKLKTDLELSGFLGIGATTLGMWKKRNHVDFEVIFDKCDEDIVYWILTGKEQQPPEATDVPEKLQKKLDEAQEGDSLIKQLFQSKDELIAYLRQDNEQLKEQLKELKEKRENKP